MSPVAQDIDFAVTLMENILTNHLPPDTTVNDAEAHFNGYVTILVNCMYDVAVSASLEAFFLNVASTPGGIGITGVTYMGRRRSDREYWVEYTGPYYTVRFVNYVYTIPEF